MKLKKLIPLTVAAALASVALMLATLWYLSRFGPLAVGLFLATVFAFYAALTLDRVCDRKYEEEKKNASKTTPEAP